MKIFHAENILLKYPRSNFKLNVPKVELNHSTITGVVGENGNGKTTLLNIIAGERAASGTYQYFEQDVTHQSDWSSIKTNIAFIPQRIPRWYGTLEQNLYLKAAMEGVKAADIDPHLNELLDFLDLQRFRKLKWTEISTGYRLRFELARVLLGNPSLLVLDEPLANLDINTQQKFLSDLKVLLSNRDQKLAVILSSQQLHEIESVADHMIFLKQGSSTFGGSLDEIAEQSKGNIFELQVDNMNAEQLQSLFKDIPLKQVGPYFHVQTDMSVKDLLNIISSNNVELRYFRDLSKSTKRFFSE